ncbi:MAG: hypothetical protein GWN76_08765, partial [candidate division Zixibacteria bacterium]|nr:hypothetical protein [candidate division Zixibacteria bacterium]NIU14089.1 hypothetical protein [candidate division Zixibacteria bacterium]NIW96993.1 hypothetical protein [Phycisphaerae bacterium]
MGLYYEHTGSADSEAFGIYNQTKHQTTDDNDLVMSGIMNRMNNWGAGVFQAVGTYNDIDYDETLTGTTYLYGTRNDLTMEAGATSTASFNIVGERTYIDITASTFDQSSIKGNEVYIASDSVAGDPDFVYGYSTDFEASGASVGSANYYAFYGDENISTTGETWGLYLVGS